MNEIQCIFVFVVAVCSFSIAITLREILAELKKVNKRDIPINKRTVL